MPKSTRFRSVHYVYTRSDRGISLRFRCQMLTLFVRCERTTRSLLAFEFEAAQHRGSRSCSFATAALTHHPNSFKFLRNSSKMYLLT